MIPITATRNLNGSYTLSAVLDSHRVQHTYYGYTLAEARCLFKEEYLK